MEQKFGKNSILGRAKRQSRAPLHHSPTVVTHPQGRHVFGEIIPNIHKTTEHLFRLSPRQKLFRSRYKRFRWNFSNFAAKQPLTMEQKLPHILQNNNDQFTCLLLCFVC